MTVEQEKAGAKGKRGKGEGKREKAEDGGRTTEDPGQWPRLKMDSASPDYSIRGQASVE